ncbi:DUF4126 family protein [Archangium violaceum]|uniref:DUF4126 family protein n=1 Tax=Archangium violaceum TaxID=83451 RepID=UPI00194F7FD0|nr:DUF4126 family protein [Archangium violaceum]QRN97806.1 DUF4126 family protein [Archangium violaceum]
MERSGVLAAAGLGAVAGMRSFSAPAILSILLARDGGSVQGRIEQALSSKVGGRTLSMLALGELVGDKLPNIPARTAPPALAGRILSGALVGAALARRDKQPVLGPVLLGAAAAVASSFAFSALRRFATQRLHVPNIVAGLLEDALVAMAGTRLLAALK